jgi:hypothetical protein
MTAPLLDRVLAVGVITVALTEGLSLFHALNRATVLASWALVVAIFLARRGLRGWSRPTVDPRVAMVLAITGVIAIIAPPNGWDALSYHMSRVVYWIQNGSVAHFPTHNIRQVAFSPFAEFGILHLQLIWGGDRLANLVQWGAFAGSLVAVAALVRRFGGGAAAVSAALVFAATLPMAILQASGTENDLVLALWLLIALLAAEENLRTETVMSALKLGAAVGLAVLTKGTAYVLCIPLLAGWASLLFVRFVPRRRALGLIAAAGLLALGLNAPYYWRNVRVFGDPLGDRALIALHQNDIRSVRVLASNVIRNASLHMATPIPQVNEAIRRGMEALHSATGLGTSDRRTTFLEAPLSVVFALHEDWAGAPLHFVAIVVVLAAVATRRLRPGRGAGACIAIAVGGFVAMAWLLKWQPWGARFQVSLFLLLAVPCGMAAARTMSSRVLRWLSAIFVLACLPYLVANSARPLITWPGQSAQNILFHSRSELYLPAELDVPGVNVAGNEDPLKHSLRSAGGPPRRWAVQASYRGAAEALRRSGCRDVGLIQAIESWDYPLWALAREDGFNPRIRQIRVRNATAALPSGSLDTLCAVVILDSPFSFPVPPPVDLAGYEVYRVDPVTIRLMPHSNR